MASPVGQKRSPSTPRPPVRLGPLSAVTQQASCRAAVPPLPPTILRLGNRQCGVVMRRTPHPPSPGSLAMRGSCQGHRGGRYAMSVPTSNHHTEKTLSAWLLRCSSLCAKICVSSVPLLSFVSIRTKCFRAGMPGRPAERSGK